MCSNNQAVRELISATIAEGTFPGVTTTGWMDQSDEGYNNTEHQDNRIIGANGILLGGFNVFTGNDGSRSFGGFGGQPTPQKETLVVERIRSVLVTALGVSKTSEGTDVIKMLACVTEALAKQCFQPTRFDLVIDAKENPFVSISFTNGFTTVTMESAEHMLVGALTLDLGIPNRYTLGTKAATLLAGKEAFGHAASGLSLEIDGKWERVCGISGYNFRKDDCETGEYSAIPGPVDLSATFGDSSRGVINTKVAEALIKQLRSVHGDIHISEIKINQYNRSAPETINVQLVVKDINRAYRLDFRA